MNLTEFNYELPDSLIAAFPSREREGSRLLVIRRSTGEIVHSMFAELGNFLDAGDLLVLNDTKVFPARLIGSKDSGGKVEVLLLERFADEGRSFWLALVDAAKKPRVGSMLYFGESMSAEVIGDRVPGDVVNPALQSGGVFECLDPRMNLKENLLKNVIGDIRPRDALQNERA